MVWRVLREMARVSALVAALPVATTAFAAPKLPVVADEALTSAERLLGKKTGDERKFACIDALPFLAIVYQNVPEYGYSTGLYAECLFLTEDWAKAEKLLLKYIALVPEEARKGAVAEKVERAQERVKYCRQMLGEPDPDAPKPAPAPVEAPKPAPVPAPTPPPAKAEARPPATPAVVPPAPPAAAPLANEFVLPPEEAPARPRPPPAPRAPGTPWARQVAVRAGYSPLAGGVGLSLEGRIGPVGLVLGSGGYPFAAGLSFADPQGNGGVYADLHVLLDASSPLVKREHSGLAFGGTAGWDFRPGGPLSIKAGLGVAHSAFLGTVVAGDLCVGAVFSL